MRLLLEMQPLLMLFFSFNSALQHNDCAELVQHCIVFTAVCVLHTARAPAGRFAVTILYQLQCLLQQNREQGCRLHARTPHSSQYGQAAAMLVKD